MIGRELIPPREEPGLGYAETVGGTRYVFADLKTLLARATPPRSGDRLARLEAADMTERVAAQLTLADLPLRRLIEDPVLPYETDEITRLIIDSHDRNAFVPIAAMTVGELRDWDDVKLLTVVVDRLRRWYRPGLTSGARIWEVTFWFGNPDMAQETLHPESCHRWSNCASARTGPASAHASRCPCSDSRATSPRALGS